MSATATPTASALPRADELLVQSESENFTVASVVLGRETRRHLMALYGYARLVDDVGDEASGDRTALLDVVDAELQAIAAGRQPGHPVMRELARTVRRRSLPLEPLHRLLAANRLDQTVTRYATYAQLIDYCRLSAAPVGELVLGVFGLATPARIALSDRICFALQIAEHLQDIAEDHARGRVYLPREDLIRFGCDDTDLSAAASAPSAPLAALVAFEAGRARALLRAGAPLAATLPWRARIAVAGFVAGGRAALDGLPVGGARPRSRRRTFAPAFAAAWVGR